MLFHRDARRYPSYKQRKAEALGLDPWQNRFDGCIDGTSCLIVFWNVFVSGTQMNQMWIAKNTCGSSFWKNLCWDTNAAFLYLYKW